MIDVKHVNARGFNMTTYSQIPQTSVERKNVEFKKIEVNDKKDLPQVKSQILSYLENFQKIGSIPQDKQRFIEIYGRFKDPFEYYDLFFNPIEKDSFEEFGYDEFITERSFQEDQLWKLSSFDKFNVEKYILKIDLDILYEIITDLNSKGSHCIPDEKIVQMSLFEIHCLLVSDEIGESALKKFYIEEGTKLCISPLPSVCSYIVKDDDVFYRPIGKDFYFRVKNFAKDIKFQESIPILQVIPSTGNLMYNEEHFHLHLEKSYFDRWIKRNIDGYFVFASSDFNNLFNYTRHIDHSIESSLKNEGE